MVKTIKLDKGVLFPHLIIQLLTLAVAYMVIGYMHKLSTNPECNKIDPYTRDGLLVYSYLVGLFALLGALGIIYLLFK